MACRRAASTTGENFLVAMGNLWRRNGRRYGGYLVHLGMVLIAVAIIGNEFYQQTTNVTLAAGESVPLGRYELLYTGLETDRQANATEFGARHRPIPPGTRRGDRHHAAATQYL